MGCYICGKEKFSDEHAPAQCFFPAGSRNNLITVDSCAEHNEATSKDDEYVRNVLTMMIQGNTTAYQQFKKKSLKSLSRSPALLHETTKAHQFINFNGIQTVALAIDRDRVDKVMRKIAYAIFYHKFGQRWLKKLITATTHLKIPNFENDYLGKLIEEIQSQHIPTYEGSNPTVFQFAFISIDDDINNQFLRMKFYDGFEMWIIPDGDAGECDPELDTIY